ncbi:conserved hypothetical protein [Ricinus communis]|uniref:Uncharacterized protein n=1 Tax=Ricinus communis TaxID=3988 RepID=B9SU54_RICCO|nr:conserved hypothetical protein [Ricinus communis]
MKHEIHVNIPCLIDDDDDELQEARNTVRKSWHRNKSKKDKGEEEVDNDDDEVEEENKATDGNERYNIVALMLGATIQKQMKKTMMMP